MLPIGGVRLGYLQHLESKGEPSIKRSPSRRLQITFPRLATIRGHRISPSQVAICWCVLLKLPLLEVAKREMEEPLK